MAEIFSPQQDSTAKARNWILLLVICSWPFLHLGVTSAQVRFLVNVPVLFYCYFFFRAKAVDLWILALGVSMFLVKAGVVASFSVSENSSLLASVREGLGFFNVVVLARFVSSQPINFQRISKALRIFFYSLAGLILIQYVAMEFAGVYIGFPVDWFAINAGPLRYFLAYNVFRPVGFYGEPSYAGFMILSLLLLYLRVGLTKVYQESLWGIAICFSVAVVAQSVAAIAAIGGLSLFWILFYKDNVSFTTRVMVVLFVVAIAAGLALLFSEVVERISTILAATDPSTATRFLMPAELIEKMIRSGEWLFGSTYFPESLDNAALQMLVRYGVLAFVPLICLLYLFRDALVWVYILLTLNFNGAMFSVDKVLVLGVVLGIFFHPQILRQRS